MENGTKKNMVTDINFASDIKYIVNSARECSYRAANLMQVASNWLLGWRIVEQEQHGERRAEYGKRVIEQASRVLTEEFGKGFSETTLRAYRQFYQTFPNLQIQQALPAEFKMTVKQIQRPLLAEFENKGNNSVVEVPPAPVQLSWMHYERLMRVKDADIYAFSRRTAPGNRTAERNLQIATSR